MSAKKDDCRGCEWTQLPDDGGWCYMLYEEPEDWCPLWKPTCPNPAHKGRGPGLIETPLKLACPVCAFRMLKLDAGDMWKAYKEHDEAELARIAERGLER